MATQYIIIELSDGKEHKYDKVTHYTKLDAFGNLEVRNSLNHKLVHLYSCRRWDETYVRSE